MDLLKEFFGTEDDDAEVTQAAPAGEATGRTEEERQQAREAKREARRAERQARRADAATEAKRAEFTARYKDGHPSEGFSAEEAIEHLQDLQKELTPAEFRKAMEETLNNLPVDQRDDFIALMRHHKAEAAAQAQAGAPAAAKAQDPLGSLLGGLMGGQGAGAAKAPNLGDVLTDLRQGGLNAPTPAAGKQLTDQDFMQLLNSPLGKAVLGGLATYGMQQLQQQQEPAQAAPRKPSKAAKTPRGDRA